MWATYPRKINIAIQFLSYFGQQWKRIILAQALVLMVVLQSCTPIQKTTKQEAFPKLYSERPLSILVLPPINNTTAADAKEYYSTTIAEPLSLAGYYVYPIEVTSEILQFEGLGDTELASKLPLDKFKEYFGADAVLFLRIRKWDTSYYVIGGNVTVSVDFVLKSTVSGENLWAYNGTLVLDTSGNTGNSGGLAGLLVKVVATAIQTAMADYIPVARQANQIALASIPYGKYHPNFGKDQTVEIIVKQVEDTHSSGQQSKPVKAEEK